MTNLHTKGFSWQKPADFLALEKGSTTNPLSHFELGNECCIDFAQFDSTPMQLSQSSNLYGSVTSVSKSSDDAVSAEKNYLNVQSKDTLQSLVQSSFPEDQSRKPMEGSFKSQHYNVPEEKQVQLQLKKSTINNIKDWNHFCTLTFQKKYKVENKPVAYSFGLKSVASSNKITTSERAHMAKKKRIRWTWDLHNQFVECVNRLGGAKKATPNGILKLMMNCEGLTILQIKSHLQRYRDAHHLANSKEDEEKITDISRLVPKLDPKMSIQMVEALRMQIHIQRLQYEQLEIQKNLQLLIEEQAKQLEKMIDYSHVETFTSNRMHGANN